MATAQAQYGSTVFATAQVSVAATATLIAAGRNQRNSITVTNTTAVAIYLGNSSGVTTSTGTLLPGVIGASLTLPYDGAVYGISSTGSNTVTVAETY